MQPLATNARSINHFLLRQDVTISDLWDGGEWNITFHRSFGVEELADWETLREKLQRVTLQRGKDIPIWELENFGQYTTRSMYRFLTYRWVINKRMEKLWHTKLPLKLKIFMWLAIQGRLQTGVALKQKKVEGG